MAARNATVDPFADPGAAPEGDDFEVDLSNIESTFRIKAGSYTGKLVNLERTVSNAGNPMWVWSWLLVDGPGAGRTFKNFTAITPQALWKVAETLSAIGLGAEGQVSKFRVADALSRLATIAIVDDSYEGKDRSSIGSVFPHPEGAGTMAKAAGQP